MKLEWSVDALTDLDRFAEFLKENQPQIGRSRRTRHHCKSGAPA
jgi:hypothetical protein